jgi:hypothetical protein
MGRRRFLLAGLVLGGLKAETNPFTELILRFNRHWGAFFREYFGCPPKATTAGECAAAEGVTDYAEFNRAAKEGRKLFPLAR